MTKEQSKKYQQDALENNVSYKLGRIEAHLETLINSISNMGNNISIMEEKLGIKVDKVDSKLSLNFDKLDEKVNKLRVWKLSILGVYNVIITLVTLILGYLAVKK